MNIKYNNLEKITIKKISFLKYQINNCISILVEIFTLFEYK